MLHYYMIAPFLELAWEPFRKDVKPPLFWGLAR